MRHLPFRGIADGDDIQRDDLGREIKDLLHLGNPFRVRINRGPDGPQPHGVSGDEDIFGSHRAVQLPVAQAFSFLLVLISADHNAHGHLFELPGFEVDPGNFLQDFGIIDHHELGGAFVEARRRGHARGQQQLDQLLRHRPGGIVPDAAAGEDGGDRVHGALGDSDPPGRLILGMAPGSPRQRQEHQDCQA